MRVWAIRLVTTLLGVLPATFLLALAGFMLLAVLAGGPESLEPRRYWFGAIFLGLVTAAAIAGYIALVLCAVRGATGRPTTRIGLVLGIGANAYAILLLRDSNAYGLSWQWVIFVLPIVVAGGHLGNYVFSKFRLKA